MLSLKKVDSSIQGWLTIPYTPSPSRLIGRWCLRLEDYKFEK